MKRRPAYEMANVATYKAERIAAELYEKSVSEHYRIGGVPEELYKSEWWSRKHKQLSRLNEFVKRQVEKSLLRSGFLSKTLKYINLI